MHTLLHIWNTSVDEQNACFLVLTEKHPAATDVHFYSQDSRQKIEGVAMLWILFQTVFTKSFINQDAFRCRNVNFWFSIQLSSAVRYIKT